MTDDAPLWSADSPFRCGRPACLCACERTAGKLACNDDGCAHWRLFPGKLDMPVERIRVALPIAYLALALGIVIMVVATIVTLIGHPR